MMPNCPARAITGSAARNASVAAPLSPEEIASSHGGMNGGEVWDDSDSVWRHSYVNWDALSEPGTPDYLAFLAIGFPLAEFVSELKTLPGSSAPIAMLNGAYARFRRTKPGPTRAQAGEELSHFLEETASDFPILASRSADLQSRIDEVIRMTA